MDKGDFVKIEYVGKVRDTGEIFDLTDEKLAKEKGTYDKDHKYGPVLAIVDSGALIKGVEEELKKMKVGEEKEFDIPYRDAFGPRDGKLVKIVSINKFFEQKINPVPGSFVNIDGANCKIQTVSGGRVRVDFNHPLANKDLHYWLKIKERVDSDENKVKELLKSYGIEGTANVEGKKAHLNLKIKVPQLNKLIEDAVKKWMPELEVVFDTGDKSAKPFSNSEEKKAEKTAEKKPEEKKEVSEKKEEKK